MTHLNGIPAFYSFMHFLLSTIDESFLFPTVLATQSYAITWFVSLGDDVKASEVILIVWNTFDS